MIDVHAFALKKYATVYVVSTPEVIRELCSFAENHNDRGDLSEETFTKRILFHNAYCCVVPQTLLGRLFAHRFTKELARRNRLIDLDAYFEAFVLANPKEAAAVLPFPREALIETARESDWALILDVDRDTVVKTLQNLPS